jgi:hypothetical protein
MTLLLGNIYAYDCEALQKPKIGLCVSAKASWLFWFNTEARQHGEGQLFVPSSENPVFTKGGYLNLSLVVRMGFGEIASASDKGPMSASLRARFIAALREPIKPLSGLQRDTILRNFGA